MEKQAFYIGFIFVLHLIKSILTEPSPAQSEVY